LLLKQVRHLDADVMYSLLIHDSFYACWCSFAYTVNAVSPCYGKQAR
jgi:hypothetical protein